jgi:hypothetical protein
MRQEISLQEGRTELKKIYQNKSLFRALFLLSKCVPYLYCECSTI